ncbi:hypothetical protein HMPREF9120_02548 [Neisseria sp. oral taxon 020 str. F0370]|nr:hypothetical protein HMPREF9120_02548 [Neisseria sp. oral taxon 020 str. F0370]
MAQRAPRTIDSDGLSDGLPESQRPFPPAREWRFRKTKHQQSPNQPPTFQTASRIPRPSEKGKTTFRRPPRTPKAVPPARE